MEWTQEKNERLRHLIGLAFGDTITDDEADELGHLNIECVENIRSKEKIGDA